MTVEVRGAMREDFGETKNHLAPGGTRWFDDWNGYLLFRGDDRCDGR